MRHDPKAFLAKAAKRPGFKRAYAALEEEYAPVRQMLAARERAGLTQEAVAARMGTTKSVVSRLETSGRHAPSFSTLQKYARAVGCRIAIKLVRE